MHLEISITGSYSVVKNSGVMLLVASILEVLELHSYASTSTLIFSLDSSLLSVSSILNI